MTATYNPTPEQARCAGVGLTAGQRLVRFNRVIWRNRVHPKRSIESRYRADVWRRRLRP